MLVRQRQDNRLHGKCPLLWSFGPGDSIVFRSSIPDPVPGQRLAVESRRNSRNTREIGRCDGLPPSRNLRRIRAREEKTF